MSTPDSFETIKLKAVDDKYASLRLVRPDVLAAVRQSVTQHGVLHPVVVNAPPDGRRVLLDGFKRVLVLRELGRSEVAARLLTLDEAHARAAILTSNAPHRGLTDLEEAWLVRSLVRELGLQQTDVATLLGRHKSWVCRRLLLAERLDAPVQDDVRLGLVGATVARELARLPRGNQAAVATSVRQHGLGSRLAAEIVDRCLASPSEEATAELLRDPLRFLHHDQPAVADPRLSAQAERMRRVLLRLDESSTLVAVELRKHPSPTWADGEREVLGAVAAAASEHASESLALMKDLLRMRHA